MGESNLPLKVGENEGVAVDTFGGRVHVEWDPAGAATPLGHLAFFIEFLKAGGLYEPWVKECPLHYSSPNAPQVRDVLGTVLLSVLAGHKRYAHITGIRCDSVNPDLLGMRKVISEDALRRALMQIEECPGVEWLQRHLQISFEELLVQPWILDIDTTVKPLYGHQEGAVVGYNPRKPGRPSHTYHSYMMANTRIILDVEVQAGNHSAASYSADGLWVLLERLPRASWPVFIRGDISWGSETFMSKAEEKDVPYLTKLRLTRNVKRYIEKVFSSGEWADAGQGWEGLEGSLKLTGWSKTRRVIVLRRTLTDNVVITKDHEGQQQFAFIEAAGPVKYYEYAVLVTSLGDEICTIAQHYRDRADSENNFDELKNQWGWGGYTTKDLKRCRIMARTVALIYNWWSLFVRLANPDKHLEAVTSRPLLLHAVGKQTRHGGQTTVTITSSHAKKGKIQKVLKGLNHFLHTLKSGAEQLTQQERWRMILSKAFTKFLKGKPLYPQNILPAPA